METGPPKQSILQKQSPENFWRFALLFFMLLLITPPGHTQLKEKEDTAYVNTLLAKSKSLFGENPSKATSLAQQAY